jgi:hypothetical protein
VLKDETYRRVVEAHLERGSGYDNLGIAVNPRVL